MRRVYRRNILSTGTLGHLCFSSRHCAAGDVVAVEVCVVFENAIVVVAVQGGLHAVLRYVPWFGVSVSRITGHDGSQKEDCCLARLSIYNYVMRSFDALGATLAVMAIPFPTGCILLIWRTSEFKVRR